MACANATVWGNLVHWTTPNQKDISHYEVYRRTDAATASITTADVVAKRYHITNTETPSVFYYDLFSSLNTSTAYWYWVKSVAFDGQRSTGQHPTITADRVGIPSIADGTVVKDPTGFPNRTDSVISFTDGTRTFSISPAVTSFDYYQDAEKFTKCAAETVVITNSTGITWFYYDSATLSSVKDPSDAVSDQLIRLNPFIAVVYWSTATNSSVFFGDERHGLNMAGATHAYLHFVFGLQYITGLAPDGITADQSGDLDEHAQFGVNAGGVTDEDVYHQIVSVGRTAGLNILYRNGVGGPWEKTTNAGFSVTTTGTGRLAFNQNIAGTWLVSEVSNNRYALSHVFASSENDDPLFAIMGQYDYATQVTAREGATTEINDLLLGDLPGPELRPIATFIFQTANGYANAVQSRIRTTDTGEDYVDWRTTEFTRGAGASDHGSLSGLSDDDHSIYVINDGTRSDQSICAGLTVGGNVAVCGTLTVSGAATFGSTVAISGATSVNNNLAVTGTLTVDGATVVNDTFTVSGSTTLQGATTVSGGLTANSVTVTGALTVCGSTTLGGATVIDNTLTVSGTTNLQGATTISGGLTANEITVTGNLTMCGTLTVNGTAITNASGLIVDFNGSSINTTNLVFDNADFSVVTGTGTCATVSLAGSSTDEKVGVDAAATPDYIGATSADGVIRISTGLTIVDGVDFITLAVNTATYASISVTAFVTTDKIACSMVDWSTLR